MKMNFNEAYEALDAMLENALADYEIAVLTEETSREDAAKVQNTKEEQKVADEIAKGRGEMPEPDNRVVVKAESKVKKVLIAIWNAIKKAVNWIRNAVITLMAGKYGTIKVDPKENIVTGACDLSMLRTYLHDAMRSIQNPNGTEFVEPKNLLKPITRVWAVPCKEIVRAMAYVLTFGGNIERIEKGQGASYTRAQVVLRNIQRILDDLTKLVSRALKESKNAKDFRKDIGVNKNGTLVTANGKNGKDGFKKGYGDMSVKYAKEADAAYTKTVNESADLTPIERMALLLNEAAQLLMEEGCEDYVDGVEGDLCQDNDAVTDVKDTVEETQDAYDPDVNGGDDELPDLEEVKDLVDDDKTALGLLTDDEGGAICEGAYIEPVEIVFDDDEE